MKIHKMEYSKKNPSQQKYNCFVIWNIPGIFQKYFIASQFDLILEYGIFRNIPKKHKNFGHIWEFLTVKKKD